MQQWSFLIPLVYMIDDDPQFVNSHSCFFGGENVWAGISANAIRGRSGSLKNCECSHVVAKIVNKGHAFAIFGKPGSNEVKMLDEN